MTQILTLFKKESRQHGAFAAAMVFMCLLFQAAYHENEWFFGYTINNGTFLAIAFFVTALYAGAAAAFAYSIEHAENTFVFLRKLPISLTTLAMGKVGWVLCGTALVLLCNLLLAVIWIAARGGGFTTNTSDIWLSSGVGIIEAFVWGLFWSTRCRSQMHALILTYACASAMASAVGSVYFSFVSPHSSDAIIMYADVAPLRLAVLAVVAIFAVWGLFRWFAFEIKPPLLARLYPDKGVFFRYPQRVQFPFLALVHQHIRHASLLYPFGILCFAVLSLGCLYYCSLPDDKARSAFINAPTAWYIPWGASICVAGIILFWGTIFGHDQRNDSYRFLSRLGISEGKVWWSRMLPAMLLYALLAACFVGAAMANVWDDWNTRHNWDEFIRIVLSTTFSVWFAPLVMGAFFSISFRSQIVAIAFTIVGAVCLLFWVSLFMMFFGSSCWWTTLPVCIALLAASRIRAGYWLRETFTWRSRIVPLVPVFGTMLAVLVALPFVRIYSVPYVSWEQIDAYFDQTDTQIPRAPEKRKALIQYIVKHNAAPPEYETYLAAMEWKVAWDLNTFSGITLEEFLLLNYVSRCNGCDSVFAVEYWRELQRKAKAENKELEYYAIYWQWLPYMPWEAVRTKRILRLNLVASLVESGSTQSEDAAAIRDLIQRRNRRDDAIFNLGGWYLPGDDTRVPNFQQLHCVFKAIDKWYAYHDGVLPESLEELVESGYLSAFPEQPFTGALMEYHRDAPPPEGAVAGNTSGRFLLHSNKDGRSYPYTQEEAVKKAFFKPGGRGTYLRLGKWVYLILDPLPEEGGYLNSCTNKTFWDVTNPDVAGLFKLGTIGPNAGVCPSLVGVSGSSPVDSGIVSQWEPQ